MFFKNKKKKKESKLQIVAISDTHNRHGQIHDIMPEADVLVHAGDFCGYGDRPEVEIFSMWLDLLPYKHKIIVAGNHDKLFQDDPKLAQSIIKKVPGVIYLMDSSVTINGIKFYGSSWMPPIGRWAWGVSDEVRQKMWSKIPKDTDILITHTPAFGCGDLTLRNERIGCPYLRQAIDQVKPKCHIFGHVHESAGTGSNGETTFINAATLNRQYKVQNKPIRFTVSKNQ